MIGTEKFPVPVCKIRRDFLPDPLEGSPIFGERDNLLGDPDLLLTRTHGVRTRHALCYTASMGRQYTRQLEPPLPPHPPSILTSETLRPAAVRQPGHLA